MADLDNTTVGQSAFAAALMDPTQPFPENVLAPQGGAATKRFAIYRNNVTVSLIDALAEVFPTVQNLVGEDFFRAMAHAYVERHPPRSRLLFEYGGNFADFIARFPPARDLPYLPDVARLERLWLDVFHEADATPLEGTVLAGIDPERLAEIRLVAHPATRLFRGDHAAVTIVSRDRTGQPLDGLNPLVAEDGLITRPGFDPELRHLPPGGAQFMETLMMNETLASAAQAATATAEDFDLAAAISAALQSGAFTGVMLDGREI